MTPEWRAVLIATHRYAAALCDKRASVATVAERMAALKAARKAWRETMEREETSVEQR